MVYVWDSSEEGEDGSRPGLLYCALSSRAVNNLAQLLDADLKDGSGRAFGGTRGIVRRCCRVWVFRRSYVLLM